MDKTAIKNFSIWARKKLIADITYKAGLLGITEEGIKDALPQSTQDAEFYDIGTKEPYAIRGEEMKQRKELVSVIRKKASQLEYKDAYRNVIEEVAYTWFNRLIAIRFMEVNAYMPAHIRVLSSDSIPSKDGWTKLEPDLVTTPFDAEIEFTQQETEQIMQMKNDNQVDALFRFLFIKQCNALNAYLPKLFEKTSDYTELLLNVSVTDQDGIVFHLTHDIKEADFNISNIGEDGKPTGQVEIIGWMYQYYNTEPKDEVFALLKKNVKITKERIPAATQLFTPDWIVRYMVENSVGRLWLEGHENEELKKGWKYYLDEAEQEEEVEKRLKSIQEEYKNIKPEEIKVIDPCMGSGHILVYAFDVLMQIYESYGYSQRDAAKSIVEHNIYGLDIDDRAFQLAYFAIMMKARSYNRRFLTLGIEPNLCAIQESNGIQYDKDMGDFLLSEEHRETLQYLLHSFVDAKEYGSILNVEKRDYDGFLKAWEQTAEATLENVVMIGWYNECNQIVPLLAKQAQFLSAQYEITVTNPPYMTVSSGNIKLNEYIKRYFPDSKQDLFAVFIERCLQFVKPHYFEAMITQQAWMFQPSFAKLRRRLQETNLVSMTHLGSRAFSEISGEVVQTTAFVARRVMISNYNTSFMRLVDYGSSDLKEQEYFNKKNLYILNQERFLPIPNSPYAYWIPFELVKIFNNSSISKYSLSDGQTKTGNNDKYLRNTWEVNYEDIGKNKKWALIAKGGSFRRWAGNVYSVINWSEEARKHYRSDRVARIAPDHICFRKGVSWNHIAGTNFSARYLNDNTLFETAAPSIFFEDDNLLYYVIGYLNTPICKKVLDFINPTLSTNVGDITCQSLIISSEDIDDIVKCVKRCIQISNEDWDEKQISFSYKANVLLQYCNDNFIENSMNEYKKYVNIRRNELKDLEEHINNTFLRIYELSGIISGSVSYEDISLQKVDERRVIREFISYAVGCMFGRYSVDRDGVFYSGGEWNEQKFIHYLPNADNIIPITDEEYFSDDIVGKFVEFIREMYGNDNLEINLDYIAKTLNCKGESSREIIRQYFISEFFDDHCNEFSVSGSGKRPIYWLFDSGKQNGFKALIYMHRYNVDTIGNLRVDYLHRMERIYESEINRMQDTIDNSSNAREVTTASKRKEKLQKQLKECQEYDEKIGHLALSRIEIDLDDGVKVNYEKVQTAKDGKKYQVLANI